MPLIEAYFESMRREDLRGVLNQLSSCTRVRFGIEAFIEPPATWGYDEKTEGYKLIIRGDTIDPSDEDCLESTAKAIGLRTMWVWRYGEFFLMIYTLVKTENIHAHPEPDLLAGRR